MRELGHREGNSPKVTQPRSGRAGQSAFLWSQDRCPEYSITAGQDHGSPGPPLPSQSGQQRPGGATRPTQGHRAGARTLPSRTPVQPPLTAAHCPRLPRRLPQCWEAPLSSRCLRRGWSGARGVLGVRNVTLEQNLPPHPELPVSLQLMCHILLESI